MTIESNEPSHPGLGVRLVDRTLVIDAAPERVYLLLTTADGLVRWMAPQADVDGVVDGVITWRHANGDRVSGRFVDLVPDRSVVFTYGWDRQDVGIPPGSTTVEITLTPLPGPDGDRTELHLVHRGLSGPMASTHDGGWGNYLARLALVAEGHDPGPDLLAHQRVPSARPVPRETTRHEH
ncbi:SRPBCC domain-containing protein [Micromonospora sp. WMMD1128]|uniref:SRPBCC family protein n=1 Tax=unclassified Micromonospora TaxID=2617518 RepID=UPI00248B7EB8|nr:MULTISPECIES: SRPBCC domain-containing protein [unclassified Micromonospora]WBB73023.1 SRPBCC domain-containing protein [Micromonospora sp. WMMD1128]WFE33528.1 SRPBCC domain-containing protein [Micromonospora sp. WMMD975]